MNGSAPQILSSKHHLSHGTLHNLERHMYLSRITNGSQLDDIENEGGRWTGGKLQHSGLTIKVEKGVHERQEEEPKNDKLTLGHKTSIRRAQPYVVTGKQTECSKRTF